VRSVYYRSVLWNVTRETSSTVRGQAIYLVDIIPVSFIKFGRIINTILRPLYHEKDDDGDDDDDDVIQELQ
jgi:hypothetical protein